MTFKVHSCHYGRTPYYDRTTLADITTTRLRFSLRLPVIGCPCISCRYREAFPSLLALI